VNWVKETIFSLACFLGAGALSFVLNWLAAINGAPERKGRDARVAGPFIVDSSAAAFVARKKWEDPFWRFVVGVTFVMWPIWRKWRHRMEKRADASAIDHSEPGV